MAPHKANSQNLNFLVVFGFEETKKTLVTLKILFTDENKDHLQSECALRFMAVPFAVHDFSLHLKGFAKFKRFRPFL